MSSIKVVPKVWGREEWIVNNELYCLKKLVVSPGGCCSLHYHRVKDETFVCEGECFLQVNNIVHHMFLGETYRLRPLMEHRFWVPPEGKECVITEVSTHHRDIDVVRLEESKILEPGVVYKGERV